MDDRTRTLIVSVLVLIIILALIGGAIFYVGRIIRGRQSGSILRGSPNPSVVVPSPSPSSTLTEGNFEVGTKSHKRAGFEVFYPQNWGLLTCKNSQNFELDPTSSTDQLGINCDVALKPITVLVGNNNCSGGETLDKGGVKFIKIRTVVGATVSYKWCTQTIPNLEISHRVSPADDQATSKKDFSKQIEEMISKIRFGTTS